MAYAYHNTNLLVLISWSVRHQFYKQCLLLKKMLSKRLLPGYGIATTESWEGSRYWLPLLAAIVPSPRGLSCHHLSALPYGWQQSIPSDTIQGGREGGTTWDWSHFSVAGPGGSSSCPVIPTSDTSLACMHHPLREINFPFILFRGLVFL